MNGYVILEEKRKVIFSFEDNILELMLKTSSEIDKRMPQIECLSLLEKMLYILGYDFSYQKCYIFILGNELTLPFGDTLKIPVSAHVEFNISDLANEYKIPEVMGMEFYGKELDYFYGVNKGYKLNYYIEDNMYNIEMVPNSESNIFRFLFEKEKVEALFGIETNLQSFHRNPMTLKSKARFKFENQKTLEKIIDLYHIFSGFLCFVAYRENITISDVALLGKREDNLLARIGTLHYNPKEIAEEDEKVIREITSYDMIKSHIEAIFNEIASGNMYLQHIPESQNNARVITPARFILIMAAFEWNVRNSYTISGSEKEKTVKEDILAEIEKIPEEKEYDSKAKKKLKFFQKVLSNIDVSLSEKIVFVLKDLNEILKPFIDDIYHLNNSEPDTYEKMGERLQTQRNNFAHGNLDKEFDADAILNIVILEWVNYAMVLKKLGYSDIEIRNLINKIFKRNRFFKE